MLDINNISIFLKFETRVHFLSAAWQTTFIFSSAHVEMIKTQKGGDELEPDVYCFLLEKKCLNGYKLIWKCLQN